MLEVIENMLKDGDMMCIKKTECGEDILSPFDKIVAAKAPCTQQQTQAGYKNGTDGNCVIPCG